MAYQGLGAAHNAQGDIEKALEACKLALQIRIALHGENHFDTASAYAMLGQVCKY